MTDSVEPGLGLVLCGLVSITDGVSTESRHNPKSEADLTARWVQTLTTTFSSAFALNTLDYRNTDERALDTAHYLRRRD